MVRKKEDSTSLPPIFNLVMDDEKYKKGMRC